MAKGQSNPRAMSNAAAAAVARIRKRQAQMA